MKVSAGILLFRRHAAPGAAPRLEVLLAHPGGPLWAHRDVGAWSLPKGEVEPGEEPAAVAQREFEEETGFTLPGTELLDLGEARLRSGKIVRAWACQGDLDPAAATSNTFSMEWPPRSGQTHEFPEIDRVAWFDAIEARRRLNPGQTPLLDRLVELADALEGPHRRPAPRTS